ncbi:TonB family protein [Saccharicrinis sp. FJH2]|uniref:TonB family protein n=1 Tax=Saccharicrinis sp. FJH65 TaxID=3344659 RepID=UPI0035F30CCD
MNIPACKRNRSVIGLFMLTFLFSTSYAAKASDDKNESPYFVVITDENHEASLPLKSTDVNVNISGVIADVNVKQTYMNTGNTPIEAIYVFPASTRSAVYDMVMKIGKREIRAVIEEKAKARNMYESAKEEGKRTSLLEQERPNVFKMNVANIMPGATIEVNLSYTELLIPTDKIYEFVYPTVVGPRYVSKKEMTTPKTETWNGNPYLMKGVKPTSILTLTIDLNTAIPIQDIRCTTHQNRIEYASKSEATLTLNEPQGGSRDFVMQYRLAGDGVQTGVLLYDDPNGENYFLAMMQPPERLTPEEIPPREYVFIVDVSGSMEGFPLDISKQIMTELLGGLKENDLFNVILFAGGSTMLSKNSMKANAENIDEAMYFINNQSGYGGTELLCGLKAAMNLNATENYARTFVILTDGYVTVEKQTFDFIRENLGKANFFSFGIGRGVNRYIIEGMAHVGYGEPFIAQNKQEAREMAEKFKTYISQPVLTNIHATFEGIDVYDVLPENVPDLFADRPVIISGKYRNNANGLLKVEGQSGKSVIAKSIVIHNENRKNNALKYLWAREKIRLVSDYNSLGNDTWSHNKDKKELVDEITRLGLQYNLLTEYTSFIAIDSSLVNPNSIPVTVRQPIPLPEGVNNSAIGRNQTPPPVSSNLNIVEAEFDQTVLMDVDTEEEALDENVVFQIVEKMPEFPGGINAMMNFLRNNITYPPEAKAAGISGRVYVSFEVDTTGNIVNPQIVRGVDSLLNAEALRVVKMMPKWIPGEQRGKKVRVSFMLPINFDTGNSYYKSVYPSRPDSKGDRKKYIKVPC